MVDDEKLCDTNEQFNFVTQMGNSTPWKVLKDVLLFIWGCIGVCFAKGPQKIHTTFCGCQFVQDIWGYFLSSFGGLWVRNWDFRAR